MINSENKIIIVRLEMNIDSLNSVLSFLVGFRGGYSDFDQFVNNGPNFFNNQFAPPMLPVAPPSPPPPFFRPQQYGFNYGYATPFNPFY